MGNSSGDENGSGSMKQWEIIADNLHNAGWSLGWVSALDIEGRTIWIVDAHGYGKRFIVRADEMLTAFLELQSAISHSRSYDRTALEVTKTLTAKPSAHSAV